MSTWRTDLRFTQAEAGPRLRQEVRVQCLLTLERTSVSLGFKHPTRRFASLERPFAKPVPDRFGSLLRRALPALSRPSVTNASRKEDGRTLEATSPAAGSPSGRRDESARG